MILHDDYDVFETPITAQGNTFAIKIQILYESNKIMNKKQDSRYKNRRIEAVKTRCTYATNNK